VHESVGPYDLATEVLADALVTETDSEDGYFAGEPFDQGEALPSFVGRAGSRGYHDRLGIESLRLVGCELIIPVDTGQRAQLPEILDEVVGEGIVVI
tara:strand:- start:5012 stop:5302 length:291 start_codon:yes stop_codon:yes gene_type:complete